MIPYGKQNINQSDIDAVTDVLNSAWLTQGDKVPAFESAIAKYCHVNFAVATNSATSSLHIACLALGLSTGDRVWTSPISFVASSNCALYCGARIDFVDINQDTANICINALKNKLIAAKKLKELPTILIVVHMAGLSCQMKEIAKLAKEYNFSIIEDASHAIGAKYQQKPVGNCQYSDITVFSFHPVKIITTAEGGVCVTNSTVLNEKLTLYRSHGIRKSKEIMANQGDWYYEQELLGFNYRMTDIQAALGLSQLKRLDEFVSKRQELASKYLEGLANLPLRPQLQSTESHSSYHLFIIRLTKGSPITRKELFEQLRALNIGVNVHYIPIYQQPYYQQFGFAEKDFPNAQQYYEECISLPMYPDLSHKDFDYIISNIINLLSEKPNER